MSQSPPWIKSRAQGLLSHRLAPTNICTGNPSQTQKPRLSASCQSKISRALMRRASTYYEDEFAHEVDENFPRVHGGLCGGCGVGAA